MIGSISDLESPNHSSETRKSVDDLSEVWSNAMVYRDIRRKSLMVFERHQEISQLRGGAPSKLVLAAQA